jgi:hypothetical protein
VAKQGLSVSISVRGLYPTLAALAKLPDDAKGALKDAAYDLSVDIGKRIRVAAASRGSQAGLIPIGWGADVEDNSTSADSDLPVVWAGGEARVGTRRKPAFKLLFGSEFGASYLKQFPPRQPLGRWFFPTVQDASGLIADRWMAAAEDVIAKFSEGGDDV